MGKLPDELVKLLKRLDWIDICARGTELDVLLELFRREWVKWIPDINTPISFQAEEWRTPRLLTPITLAARHGRHEVVKILLTHPLVDVNCHADGGDGWTAFMYACSRGYLPVVALLVADGRVDPNIQQKSGYTALMAAIGKGREEVVEYLIAERDRVRIDINARNLDLIYSGGSAIHHAIQLRRISILRHLLKHPNIDLGVYDHHRTPLIHAIDISSSELALILLDDSRTDINAVGKRGAMTPLMVAVQRGLNEVTRVLLTRNSIDINACTRADESSAGAVGGFTAMHFSCLQGNVEVAKMLLGDPRFVVSSMEGAAGCPALGLPDSDALSLACWSGSAALVKVLLADERVRVDLPYSNRPSPLLCACLQGDATVVRALLSDPRIDPNLQQGPHGSTVLLEMCLLRAKTEVFDMIVRDERVDLNASDQRGWFPRQVLTLNRDRTDLLKILLRHKDRIDFAQTFEGKTVEALVSSMQRDRRNSCSLS